MPKCYQQQTMDRTSSRPNSKPPNADKMHICIRPEECRHWTERPDTVTPSSDQMERRPNAGTIPGNAERRRGSPETIRRALHGPHTLNRFTCSHNAVERPYSCFCSVCGYIYHRTTKRLKTANTKPLQIDSIRTEYIKTL